MGNGRFARPPLCDNTIAMFLMDEYYPRTRFGDWPLALKSILGFWLFYYLTVAPEKEVAAFQETFRRIGESIRLTDAR